MQGREGSTAQEYKYPFARYRETALAVWKDLGLAAWPEPTLQEQLHALPPIVYHRGRYQGHVFCDGVHASLRLTSRHVRTCVSGFTEVRDTVDVTKIVVVHTLRRQGKATAFLRGLIAWAADAARVVFVESVLSETLARILVRLGFVRQDPWWSPGDAFEAGQNFANAVLTE
jgi:hypothetical protein